jgi:hypothetical protein
MVGWNHIIEMEFVEELPLHLPPDTTACIFWLKNQRKDLWRDRFDYNVKPVRDVVTMTDDELAEIIRREQSASAHKAAGSGNGVAEPPDSRSVH